MDIKSFIIRVKEESMTMLDKIARESNRSRNELINLFLKYGTANYKIVEWTFLTVYFQLQMPPIP